MDTKITIAIPTYRNMPSQFFWSFLAMYEHTKKRFSTGLINCDNTYIEQARNTLIDLFIKKPADYLFFLDSDMLVPQDIIERLIEHDKDVVSAIYFGRSQSGETHAMASKKINETYKNITSFPKGLIEVDAVGLGSCLIKKKVILELAEKLVDEPFFMNKFISRQEVIGEDFYFCEILKKNGYNIFVDPATQCGHIGGIIDTKYYLANRK